MTYLLLKGEYDNRFIPRGTKPIEFGGRDETAMGMNDELQTMEKKINKRIRKAEKERKSKMGG